MHRWLLVLGVVLIGSTALAGAPTIGAIVPDSGSAGDTVRIIGKNLAARDAETTVTIGGATAEVLRACPWSIAVKVPAIEGLTLPAEVQVIVTVDPAEGDPLSSEPETFTIVERGKPAIEKIVPAEGYPGTAVKIVGTSLSRSGAKVTVKFGGAETSGLVWRNQVYTRVPKDLTTPGDVPVTVVVGDVESNAVTFTVKAFPDPIIDGVDPAEGPPGTIVKITGDNFTTAGRRGGALTVKFGEAEAKVIYRRDGVIVAIVPAGLVADTTVDVTVDVDGRSAVKAGAFKVLAPPPPSVESISPAHGTAGTAVRIKGKSLDGSDAVEVTIGGKAAEKVIVSNRGTLIIAIVPVGAATGEGAVTVTVDGVAATGPDGGLKFTVDPIEKPVIESLTPATGPAGTKVVIKGTDFTAGVLKPVVTFGGIEAKSYFRRGWSWGRHHVPPAIVAIVPEGLTEGAVGVVVTVGDAASDPSPFTVTAAEPPAGEGERTGG